MQRWPAMMAVLIVSAMCRQLYVLCQQHPAQCQQPPAQCYSKSSHSTSNSPHSASNSPHNSSNSPQSASRHSTNNSSHSANNSTGTMTGKMPAWGEQGITGALRWGGEPHLVRDKLNVLHSARRRSLTSNANAQYAYHNSHARSPSHNRILS